MEKDFSSSSSSLDTITTTSSLSTSDPSTIPLKIAIIGAGPGGCMLALLLSSSPNINITIFERESSINHRSQGGTLDLHQDTGLLAIKRAGLYEQFVNLARFDGDALQLFDKEKIRYLNLGSSKDGGVGYTQGKPEIDRVQLRRLLLKSLPEGTIRWGCKFQEAISVSGENGEGETWEMRFDHGTEKGFDLIVGADGAFSKVRKALTPQKVLFSKIGGFLMSIPQAEKNHPDIYKFVKRGSVFAFGDGKDIIGQQMGDGSVCVVVWIQTDDEEWMKNSSYDVYDGEAVKKYLGNLFGDWDSDLLALITAVDPASVEPRSLWHLPTGMRWVSKRGVTLIGDAAHVMTPFVGEGVNAALRDAVDLADCIISGSKNGKKKEEILDEIEGFEEDMIKRVTKAQVMTEDMKNLMLFTKGAPRSVIEKWIIRSMSDDLNFVLLMGLTFAVYLYFFFFKLLNRSKR